MATYENSYAGPFTPVRGAAQNPLPQQSGFGSMRFNNLGAFMGQVPGMYQNAMQPYQTGGQEMLGNTLGNYQQLEASLGTPQGNLQNAFNSYQSMLGGMVPAMQAAQQAEVGGAFAPRMAAQTQALQYAQGQLGTGLTQDQQSAYLRAIGERYGNQMGSLQGPAMAGYMTQDFAMADLQQRQQQYQNLLAGINAFETPNAWAGQAGGAYAQGANMFGSQMANNVLTPQNYLGLAGQYAQQDASNRMAPWNAAMGLMGKGEVYGGGGGGNPNADFQSTPTWGPQGPTPTWPQIPGITIR